jgi:hypothetical protein
MARMGIMHNPFNHFDWSLTLGFFASTKELGACRKSLAARGIAEDAKWLLITPGVANKYRYMIYILK